MSPPYDFNVFVRFMERWTDADRAKYREISARHYPVHETHPVKHWSYAKWNADEWANGELYEGDELRCFVHGEVNPHLLQVEHEEELPTSWFQASNGCVRKWTSVSGEFTAR